jgi:putative endonuclease
MRRAGSDAEDRAAEYLLSLGYSLITRRYKATSGELDIVAMDGEELVFVEVKQRNSGAAPEEFVGNVKIERLQLAANHFRRTMDMWGRAYRFDVVAIQGKEMRHHQNALNQISVVDDYEPELD